MLNNEYYSHLYEIASQLNREFSLHAVLRSSLEKTVQLLGLSTGWIWLAQEDAQSVYLAASYQLPPALSNHPERLSGYCYCIKKYLSDEMDEASNISEITCTRLKDVKSGTLDLKFHASIPISINNQKIGLLNLLTKEQQQLNQAQLHILNTIAELIATAVHRSRSQTIPETSNNLQKTLERVIQPRVDQLEKQLISAQTKGNSDLETVLAETQQLKEQLALILENSDAIDKNKDTQNEFRYPYSPLTNRELEVLTLVKRGYTNRQIANDLFISERTVKFHMSSLLSKLQAKTRTEAVDVAVHRGLIGL